MPRNKRVSQTDYEHRLHVMAGLLARGLTTMQVTRFVCQQWDICERTAMRHLKDAKKQIDSQVDLPIREHYNYIFNVLKYSISQAALDGDQKVSATIAAKLAKIVSQAKKDLAYDTKHTQGEADFIGLDEMEEFLRAFEEPGKDKTGDL